MYLLVPVRVAYDDAHGPFEGRQRRTITVAHDAVRTDGGDDWAVLSLSLLLLGAPLSWSSRRAASGSDYTIPPPLSNSTGALVDCTIGRDDTTPGVP